MLNKFKHLQSCRHSLLIWFLLFSLSPCTTKGLVFTITPIDFVKPFNKTKAVSQNSLCQYLTSDHQYSSSKRKATPGDLVKPTSFSHIYENIYYFLIIKYDHNSTTSSGSSPPKYILFKKLKIHLA